MGILKLMQRKEEKKPLGICIPEHRNRDKPIITPGSPVSKTVKDSEAKELLTVKAGSFRVNGSYRVMDTLMLSGTVEEGMIRKRMKARKSGKELRVTEVRQGNEVVENLLKGEEGTIFIAAKLTPIIGFEEILSFKG